MGNDVHRVTLSVSRKGKHKHDVCARCWHARQIKTLVGPCDGFIQHARDFYAALQSIRRADRRWRKLSFRLTVMS